MASGVRETLDGLQRETLARLLRERGLPLGGSLPEKRKHLSYSYRGNLSELVYALQRQELVAYFDGYYLQRDGVDFELPSPSSHSKDELQRLLIRFYEDGRGVPTDFEASFDDDEGEEEEPEDDVDQLDEAADDEAFAESFSDSWSRPLLIRRLLLRFDGDHPQRLRAERFRGLVDRLLKLGLKMQLPDGEEASDESASPGIEAKVRLRRVGRLDRAPRVIDAKPTVAPTPSRSVEFVPGGTGPSRDVLAQQGYALALLRLQFLTAIPDHARPGRANWPDEFIATATAGLHLLPDERTLLTLASASFAMGSQSPFQIAQLLRPFMAPQTWEPLFRDFVLLNNSLGPMAEKTIELVRSSLGIGSAGPTQRPAPQTTAQVFVERHEEKQAASAESSTNRRDLGSLEDMFGPTHKS